MSSIIDKIRRKIQRSKTHKKNPYIVSELAVEYAEQSIAERTAVTRFVGFAEHTIEINRHVHARAFHRMFLTLFL